MNNVQWKNYRLDLYFMNLQLRLLAIRLRRKQMADANRRAA